MVVDVASRCRKIPTGPPKLATTTPDQAQPSAWNTSAPLDEEGGNRPTSRANLFSSPPPPVQECKTRVIAARAISPPATTQQEPRPQALDRACLTSTKIEAHSPISSKPTTDIRAHALLGPARLAPRVYHQVEAARLELEDRVRREAA